MERWTTVEGAHATPQSAVVTLGNFDGVHRGHQSLLGAVSRLARDRGERSIAVTFDPHPVAVLHPERAPEQIIDPDYRMTLMAHSGVDVTVMLPFTHDFAQMGPEEFVRDVLVRALGAAVVVVGEDTRFGVGNSGDVDTLRQLGCAYGFEVRIHEIAGDQAQGRRLWSSSAVRESLREGAVHVAAEILGRLHRVAGTVVHGHHRGRELGYPTANLGPDRSGMVPADGVYAGWVERVDQPPDDEDRRLPAAISVGTNPTFADVPERTVEAYVLDRLDLDLYHETVGVDFVCRLRDNVRFDSVDQLRRQMARDVAVCRSVLLG
ncbi:MAG TPA: bifunctional riboflavin kinase/FAD synthetase [Ornithinimicrobium sp.]|uniref:bifunctional riboflavin kinase/FAD synthetase n=1 Tax=Ornithinimicrobium sp. TaxID=1977084 RepID=UPI002B45A5AF|nr:bifunctional riboflavin kinase/FAD synthetase [Ornithinimicrobium sp.]HKJ11684.1 bifunctional riboflavin kinase/FAD synthetase [Ornithinimicrobium sp.]